MFVLVTLRYLVNCLYRDNPPTLPLREDVVNGWSPSSLSKRSMHFQVSVFRFSAWKFNEDRGQFYYHAFTPEQPDLNYRNPMVVEEMKVSLNSVGCSL